MSPPFVEAYLASNLGLYGGSSALLSPTSPSTSSSVPSLSQDSHMPSRHADERDRASPITSAAGSSQSRDSTSGNNSTNIGRSSNSIATSSKRLDRHSRESLDGKSGSSVSSQSRAHSHAVLRTDGHNHQEKSSHKEGSSGGHRRSSHVSPDSNSRRNSLEIKRESTDSERALKDVPAKSGHSVPTETKIKDEKSDTDTSRLDNCNKNQVENNADSPQREKQIAKDVDRPTGSSEKVSNCGEAFRKTDSRQISSLSVSANDSDNVKTERISPVASASANKTTEVRSRASEKGKANAEANNQTKEKVEGSDNSKILNSNVESDSEKEKVQVDKDFTAVDEGRRKSTDSSSLRSEPIDIRPQRDLKESGSPEKMDSEVSLPGSSESSVVPEGSPAGQKDPSRVKLEKSPVGSGGSSVGPAKVLTATSGGVVYAMYPAG